MRGENAAPTAATLGVSGTSPRARGKLWVFLPHTSHCGNIPACAGKLRQLFSKRLGARNIPACAGKTCAFSLAYLGAAEHPHVRGENQLGVYHRVGAVGTSPRARGKLGVQAFHLFSNRNIPACAGKTRPPRGRFQACREHPRVRGENPCIRQPHPLRFGTSPRARGKQPTPAGPQHP